MIVQKEYTLVIKHQFRFGEAMRHNSYPHAERNTEHHTGTKTIDRHGVAFDFSMRQCGL